MSLEDNELWKAFLEEVREQLEYLEAELLNAKSANEEGINQLFRFFHSIKSSSAIFEFTAMEQLAHAAETLLDQVRKGYSAVTDDVVNVLLMTADCLKSQLAEAEKTLKAPGANEPLLQELLAFCVDNPEARQVEKEAEKAREQQSSNDKNVLGVDPVQLEEFAEMCEMALTNFFNLLGNKNKTTAVKSLNRLIKAANGFEFTKLSRSLTALVTFVNQEGEIDNKKLFDLTVKIVDQIQMLEKLSEQAFPLRALYDHFYKLFGEDYAFAIKELKDEIASCILEMKEQHGLSEKFLTALCEHNENIINYFRIFDFTSTAELFRYFNQVCRKSLIGHISPDSDIFSLILGLLEQHIQALGDQLSQQLVDVNSADALKNFRESLNRKQDDAFHRQERIEAMTTLLNIDPEYMDYIDNSEIELLEYCVKAEKSIAIMVVDVEANQEWSLRFLQWLNLYELITSRTVHCKKEKNGRMVDYTKTSFLVVFEENEFVVRQSLAELGNNDAYIDEFSFRYPNKARLIAEESDAGDIKVVASNMASEADSSKTIRVNSDAIDRFVSQVGEMVLQRNMLSHVLSDTDLNATLKNCRTILEKNKDGNLSHTQMEEMKNALASIGDFYTSLLQANAKLAENVSRVQKDVMTLRVVPISIVFNRLPRVIRNINVDYGKDIRLQLLGEQVRVDKSMVDVLMEPLVHLVRNCADHGIESREERDKLGKTAQAMIVVSAEQTGNYLEIKISDNGRGLNFEKIRQKAVQSGIYDAKRHISDDELKMLIFRPGFSTADKITETSGRGVGMDAVRTRISAIGGSIEVHSKLNEGTSFTLKLPVSAAIQGVILFSHGGETLTIPERNVVLGLTIPVSQIQSVQGQAAFIHQGEIMPLYGVADLLGWGQFSEGDSNSIQKLKTDQEVIIISDDNFHIGLAVDKVLDRQEIFVRELHDDLMRLPGVGGVSILGNGDVVIILDAEAILKIASKQSQSLESLLKVS